MSLILKKGILILRYLFKLFIYNRLMSFHIKYFKFLQVIAAFYSLVNAIHYKKIIDSTGQYQLIPSLVSGNKWPSMKRFTTFADISLVTQCSLKHLNKLIDLAERWKVLKLYLDSFEIKASRYLQSGPAREKAVMQKISFEQ